MLHYLQHGFLSPWAAGGSVWELRKALGDALKAGVLLEHSAH